MGLARFLQLSDLHLGRPFGWLPPDRRAERRTDQRRCLELAVTEAIERGVHAILIPGDLFDLEGVDSDTMAFAIGSAFDVAGCPPVFIAPGNHDPYFEGSHYWNPRRLAARGLAWPAHVHVFAGASWSAAPVPALEGVRVWGRCFTANVPSLERPLEPSAMSRVSAPNPKGFDVAVFHGSREGHLPPAQKLTGPFSDDEVLRAPFAYLAAGHYHQASRIVANDGSSSGVRLAYAGSAVAIDATEVGVHGALEVRIEYGSHRRPFVEVELVELDPRKVHDLTADVTGCTSAERVDRRIQKALEDAGVTTRDIVTVRLSGRLTRGVRYAAAPSELAARAFHLRLDRRALRPDHDLEALAGSDAMTTEEKFARALLEERDREKDPVQRAMIESALYYGLDAFRLREVVPAWEELEE